MTEGYGTTIRAILEIPILSGLRTEDITDDDRASATAAAVSMLRHHSPRQMDVNTFTLTSVGEFTDCPQCGREHRIKPFRGKRAEMIYAASRGEPYARMLEEPAPEDARELDTILAALRYWQMHGGPTIDAERSAHMGGRVGDQLRDIADISHEHGAPLNMAEIDALCERLNTGGN